ncbi:hypothetical protein KQI11_05815 [Acetanaerobacterium sp. MSJ-12]|nr:hypothetical protein [Acetanaerobacterium sp. MSJ-12]
MYKVGDRVRIVNYRTEEMNGDGEMDKWLGKVMTVRRIEKHLDNPYKMEEDRDEYAGDGWFWCDGMIAGLANTLTIEIDPADKAAAHKAVEDAIAEHQRKAREWTEAEIEEATRLSDEMILELHHRHLSPVLGYKKSENKTVLHLAKSDAESGRRWKEYTSFPRGDDPFDYDIGRCVCLCRATGRKIPEFIREKNRGYR